MCSIGKMGFASGGAWLWLAVMAVVLVAPLSVAVTDPRDVTAINDLYISLGSPPLQGWIAQGGDPCGELWQGVDCVFSNITGLRLNGMNLGGSLTESLGNFESIIAIDLSNNQIGGSIPSNLPLTIRNFSLSGNKLNGNIPGTLSTLSQMSELFLNDNSLSGGIPDAFQQLSGLTNLDISGNNLTDQLPPSMASLSSLKTLHLQNNKLIGVLDVLQDLSLVDLNIEYNLFSGPIPANLLNIPNFRKDGNPFNTTILPSPPPPAAFPPSVALPPLMARPPYSQPGKQAYGPSFPDSQTSDKAKTFWTTKTFIYGTITGVLILFVIVVVCVSTKKCCKTRRSEMHSDKHDTSSYKDTTQGPTYTMQAASREPVIKPVDGYGVDNSRTSSSAKPRDERVIDVMRLPTTLKHKTDHETNSHLVPPPAPSALLHVEEEAATKPTVLSSSRISAPLISGFTIASLQQYTDSFSDENLIGEGLIGSVYRAELPDGKLLAVKKLDSSTSRQQSDKNFVDIVSCISKLKHENILEFVGYCNEHGQRLLVYEYCPNGTLYDLLHFEDETHKKLTWDARVRVAIGASRALQYLHEVCQPPVVHGNFKSANVLLNEKLGVRVSDCGLAPLLTSVSTSQLSGYAAPEAEMGTYTCSSDVYSLGIVMLELLTGRKSYDRTRPRGEHSLARWAIQQLHDIDALSRMVDPSLNGAYPVKSLSRFADIILRCVQWEPGFRPPISEIVQDLLHMI